jgi:hypothetical protein
MKFAVSDLSKVDISYLSECDAANECPTHLGQCNVMINPTPSGKNGFCVPSFCQTDDDCPDIGNECNEGTLSGACNTGTYQCQYNPVVAIATCEILYDARDDTTLLGCSTADDCPRWESGAQCVETSLGNSYCVPSRCEDNACPSIGDLCQDGVLDGTCNAESKCEYAPVIAIAYCGPTEPSPKPSPSQNCNCQCDSYTWTDGQLVHGNCRR